MNNSKRRRWADTLVVRWGICRGGLWAMLDDGVLEVSYSRQVPYSYPSPSLGRAGLLTRTRKVETRREFRQGYAGR